MENASKALLIAGAVLIVILLIGLGMLIYSKATGVVDTAASTMSTQEIQAFNAQFTGYEGVQRGSSIKSLISTVMASNATYQGQTGSSERLITVAYINKSGEEFSSCEISTISKEISTKILATKSYTVSFTGFNNGFIAKITIEE